MKVVTVGTGRITQWLITGFKEVGIEVFACVGRDKQKTEKFARDNDIKFHGDNYDLILQSNAFDTVYLGIPNALHYEYAKKALLAGKNVIVEKPFTSTVQQAMELIAIADSKNLIVYDAMMVFHNIAYKQIKQDIKALGKIKLVELDFSKKSSKINDFYAGKDPSCFSTKLDGGALKDLNVYCISFAVGLFGRPESCHYYANVEKGIDTSGIAILKYKDFVVSCSAGKDCNKGNLINIMGTNGYIYSNQTISTFNKYVVSLDNHELVKRAFPEVYSYHYELEDLKSIMTYKDHKKNNEYLTSTLITLKVIEELQESMNK